jgi:predicted enzyme related to lactoylglutathione lyase
MSTTPRKPATNIVNWFEIAVSNLDRAAALYGAMLDLQPRRVADRGIQQAIFKLDEAGVGGALIADPQRPPRPGSTVIYLHARDGVARSLARAVEVGAKVIQPVTAIDPNGKIALIEDLDGNVIGLHEHPTAV